MGGCLCLCPRHQVRRLANVHDGGAVAVVDGCRSGRLLLSGADDGRVLAHDLRMKQVCGGRGAGRGERAFTALAEPGGGR